jgi:hypothetical protein
MHEAATATTTLIGACSSVAAKPTDKQLQTAMGASANAVVNAIRKLLDATSALSPGVKECERAREAAQLAINDLGSASLAVAVGNLDVQAAGRHVAPAAPAGDRARRAVAAGRDVVARRPQVVGRDRGRGQARSAAACPSWRRRRSTPPARPRTRARRTASSTCRRTSPRPSRSC